MDLKYLSRVQDSQQLDRRQTAQITLNKGLGLLANARMSGYAGKDALEQAARELIHAIKQNRREVRAFLGLGYIFMLWGNRQEAWYYLNEARKLDPRNQDVESLMGFLRDNPDYKAQAVAGLEPVWTSEDEADLDLYDQTADAIRELVRMVTMELNPSLEPVDELSDIEFIYEQFAALSTARGLIELNLDRLEETDNTESLRKALQPVDVMIRRYQATLAACSSYMRIREQVAGGDEYLSYLEADAVALSRADSDTLEAHFEKLYDHCDRIADQLDAIESPQPAYKRLSDRYRSLMKRIEALRDYLDDLG